MQFSKTVKCKASINFLRRSKVLTVVNFYYL